MKIIWRVVIILIVAGLILSLLGVALGANRWIYWDKRGSHIVDKSEEKRITKLDLEQIDNIDIDSKFSDVEFITSDKYGIDICYYDEDVSWSLDNGNLKIRFSVQASYRNFSNRFFDINLSFDYPRNYIKVYLPADVRFGTVSVQADSGDMKIGDFHAGEVKINNSYGNTDVNSITCDKLQVELNTSGFTGNKLSVSGDIEYKNSFGLSKFESIDARDFKLDSNSGDVTVNDCDVNGFDINNSFGSIDTYSITCDKLQIKTNSCDFSGKDLSVSGDIIYKNKFGASKFETIAAKNFLIDIDSGDLTVKGCHVESVDIKNDFGNITANNLVSLKTDIDASSAEMNISGEFSGRTNIKNNFGNIKFTTSKSKDDYTYDVYADFGDVTFDNNELRGGAQGGNSSENSLYITNSSGDIQVYFAG
jgi:DUF4097 and DUF4098 domain-containing protein YvlB